MLWPRRSSSSESSASRYLKGDIPRACQIDELPNTQMEPTQQQSIVDLMKWRCHFDSPQNETFPPF